MKTTWKKRAVQTSLLAIMTTIAFGAVSASAADTTTDTKTAPAIQMVKAVGSAPALHFRSSSVGLLNQPAHERNYLKLLVTTYAPDTLADWKKALDDRKQVEADMPKSAFAKTVTIASKDAAEGAVQVFPAEGAAFVTSFEGGEAIEALPLLPTLTAAEIKDLPEGVAHPTKGFITSLTKSDGTLPEQITRVLPVEAGVASDIMIAKPVESESMKLQQKLAEAVEADDAEAIRAILPDVWKDFVKGTEDMREMTTKIKEQQATEAENK
ncbi:hypothetical protein ASG89_17665 [Paenibacillus sp. Soil766]|uniref:hypothetical protein n=1 Tax=Paenibacillus sp. Soil766 TaxID=1736404 RepID=UPI00070BC46B|nr:hypothetical protein [Paenibacillus sp. Soil766]KRF07173.1 hypothetical protein ASG89_17665 [Paenibacillus sp. Soil766]